MNKKDIKIIENRLVEFLTGCGVLYAAYHTSPHTITEIFIAVGGCALGGLILLLSWMRDQEQTEMSKRRLKL